MDVHPIRHSVSWMRSQAICLSVQNSQGREYVAAIMVCAAAYRRLVTRRLVYTAIPRAKRLGVIIGGRAQLAAVIDRDDETQRGRVGQLLPAGERISISREGALRCGGGISLGGGEPTYVCLLLNSSTYVPLPLKEPFALRFGSFAAKTQSKRFVVWPAPANLA